MCERKVQSASSRRDLSFSHWWAEEGNKTGCDSFDLAQVMKVRRSRRKVRKSMSGLRGGTCLPYASCSRLKIISGMFQLPDILLVDRLNPQSPGYIH
jgi:hypothetical protein